MKKPDEIKKGLECCSVDAMHCGYGCPYMDDCHSGERFKLLEKDALAYILLLEAENTRRHDKIMQLYNDNASVQEIVKTIVEDSKATFQQFENKLNQAVEDIRMLGRTGEFICPVCAHYNHGEGTSGECVKCLTGDGFRWRGEKEEEHAD